MARKIGNDGVRATRVVAGGLFALVLSACQHYSGVPLSPEVGLGNFYGKSLGSEQVSSALKRSGLSRSPSWSVPMLVAAGEATNPAIARERATYERDEADARRQVKIAEAALGKAFALPANEVAGITLRPLPETIPAISLLTHWERQAALKRPDVLAGLADYAVADAAMRLEIRKQYPDLNLNSDPSFDQGQTKWLLGPSLSILPDLNRAGIGQARSKLAASRAAFEEIQTGALTDVSSAWADYRGSLDQLEKARNLAAKSRDFSKMQKELMKVGEGSRLAVLQYQFLQA